MEVRVLSRLLTSIIFHSQPLSFCQLFITTRRAHLRSMPYIFAMHDKLPTHVSKDSDDNDSCAACGGAGFLLCCDGCDRSFHFSCLDPPIDQDQVFESQWFCSRCEAERDTSKRPPQGLFADLEYNIEKNNPRSFTLPQYIRDYFKDVKTADSGEYSVALEQRPM